MDAKQFIKEQIMKILLEQEQPANNATSYEQTTRIGGGIKKELRNLKALADDNPAELMKRLRVNGVPGQTPNEMLFNLLSQAINNSEEMAAAYASPGKERDQHGRNGAKVDLTGELDARDGVIFIRHTIRGARNAGMLPFKDRIQIELLGNSILTYPDSTSYSWNAVPRKAQPKSRKQTPPGKQGLNGTRKK